jgi:hypothetical protein
MTDLRETGRKNVECIELALECNNWRNLLNVIPQILRDFLAG